MARDRRFAFMNEPLAVNRKSSSPIVSLGDITDSLVVTTHSNFNNCFANSQLNLPLKPYFCLS
jgi:hypothetical protein